MAYTETKPTFTASCEPDKAVPNSLTPMPGLQSCQRRLITSSVTAHSAANVHRQTGTRRSGRLSHARLLRKKINAPANTTSRPTTQSCIRTAARISQAKAPVIEPPSEPYTVPFDSDRGGPPSGAGGT